MIENYTIIQWLAFFLIYCFIGWCIESTIVSVTNKKLVNRGFLIGPFLPIYGFGAIVMLMGTLWIKEYIVAVYLIGMIGATCLEYITGKLMEAVLKMKYWDYSNKRFNLNGYICLSSSLFWGVLTVFLVYVAHAPVAALVTHVDQRGLFGATAAFAGVMIVDCINSFKNAFDLQKFLAYQTKIREELSEMSSKLSDIKNNMAGSIPEWDGSMLDEKRQGIEKRIEKLKSELEAGRDKVLSINLSSIKSFPSATSKKFNDALQELKAVFNK